jgi:hypothetical protein
MKHKPIKSDSELNQFPRFLCECNTKIARQIYLMILGSRLRPGASCESTAEFLYEHLAIDSLKFKIGRIYHRHSSELVEMPAQNPKFNFKTFSELKMEMGKKENNNMVWYFVDSINDHAFIILKIENEFTLLHSWVNLWGLESWLADESQFPTFYQEKLSTNVIEKMRAFQAKMGQSQFFPLEEFWKNFEESYADYLQAMTLSSFEDNNKPYIFVRNYIEIGQNNIVVLNASKIKTKYLENIAADEYSKL